MNRLLVAAALGAAAVSVPALAQQGGGQRDQTRAEAQQRADMMFQMIDANHDGTITRAEADQALAQFQSRMGDNGGHGGGRLQRIINDAFANSQSLTLQQLEAQALARFDAADLNHDGVVTAAERQQARDRQAGIQQTPPPKPQ